MNAKTKIFIGVLVIGIVLICGCVEEKREGVTITTDKTEYTFADMINGGEGVGVRFTIKNNLEETIYLLACPFYYVETKKDNKWSGHGDLCGGTDIVNWEIEPGESLDEFDDYRMLVPGTHRIVVFVNFNCTERGFGCSRTEKIYSNEFTIKPKKEVTIKTDKTAYTNRSEASKIKVLFYNDTLV